MKNYFALTFIFVTIEQLNRFVRQHQRYLQLYEALIHTQKTKKKLSHEKIVMMKKNVKNTFYS